MKATTVGIMILVGLFFETQTAFAQAQVWLCNPDFPLLDECVGGNPLPDGTPVRIYWDANNNGPDPSDLMPPVGDCPACLVINTFPLNGEEVNGIPGTFCLESNLVIGAGFPQPWRFFLRVLVCDHEIKWTTPSFNVSNGYQEMILNNWTCGTCFEADPPGAVTGLTATQNRCNGVLLRWDQEPAAWAYQVLDLTSDTTYLVFGSPIFISVPAPPNCRSYSITAFNEAGSGPPSAPAQGCWISDPPAIVSNITATENLCGAIEISWQPAAGAEMYIIFINTEASDTVDAKTFEYRDEFSWFVPYGAFYTVVGRNGCGNGPVAAYVQGHALREPPRTVGVEATNNLDDRVHLLWWNDPGESGFEVWRTEAGSVPRYELIATLAQDSAAYNDFSAIPGQEYYYRVRSFNESCGDGDDSDPVRGVRQMVEPIEFAEVVVTDSLAGAMSVVAADLDIDGDMDVVACGMFSDKVCWYENDGSWNFTDHVLVSSWQGARAVDVADVDGDGDLDIVAVAKFENALAWWEKVEGGYWMQPISSTVMGATDVEVVNVTGGGEVEILTAAANGGEISRWDYHGDAGFTRAPFASNLPGIRSLSSEWFMDPHSLWICGAASESGELAQWSSLTGYAKQTIGVVPGVTACGIAQLNIELDSFHDVFYCTDEGGFGWWDVHNEVAHEISNLIEAPRDLAAAFVDDDNRADLLLASGSEISWWRNTQNRYYRNVIADDLEQASSVQAIDADGDGDIDVLAGGDNKIRFYLSTRTDAQNNNTLLKPPIPEGDHDTPINSPPREFALNQNYPNPFNPVTQIQFALPEASNVTLAVFDITGREVVKLLNGRLDEGTHSVEFRAHDLASGVYLYRLQAGAFVETRKMVLMK